VLCDGASHRLYLFRFATERGSVKGVRQGDSVASNLVHNALANRTQVFPVLTSAQIGRVRPSASLRHATLGEVLFEADASDVAFFILLSGTMEVVQPDMDGERPIANHGPGEFTGEMTMITGHRSLVRGRMTEPGDVLELSGSGLRELVARDGELARSS
jgi:thioredoxin reductase (NADPH)